MPSEERGGIAGKHALVTGGTRGIGLAIATLLAQRGAKVSIVGRSASAQGAQALVRAEADVTDEAQIARAFDACRRANGSIDILVNNAGFAKSAPIARTDRELWDRTIAANLTGTFLCTRAAIEEMIAAKWGRIVNVASTAGLGGAAYVSAYCAAKHGVVGFTRAVAAELAGSGVTANAVCPGYTETEMLERAIANIVKLTGATEGAARARLAGSNPQGRIATAQEVAQGVLDLIASSHNGVAFVIPGGALA